jgi:hypothetical protein
LLRKSMFNQIDRSEKYSTSRKSRIARSSITDLK